MTLGNPWALVLLIILLFLPKQQFRWLRALALVAVIVALAQPKILEPSQQLSILLDVSDSVTTTSLEIARANELDKRGKLFAFATDVMAIESLETPEFLNTSQTDIAKALQVLSAGQSHRALLISDGKASLGNTLASLPNFPVDTFYIPSQPRLRLSRLIVPLEVTTGETVEISAVLESDTPTSVTLNPFAGNTALEPIMQTIPAGQSVIPFRFKVEGQQDIDISVTLSNAQNQDSQQTTLNVLNAAPILVIDDPAMFTLLQTQGFNAVAGVPEDIHEPLDYSAIILRGGAAQYTQGQLELLESYVLSGGGLMMTGGPTSFGFGGWYRSPLESVLPVNTDLRTEVQLPLVALVMILDRSQSMSSGNPSKLELAKEGALNVVDLAYQEDLLGMVIFSDGSATQWAFEPRKATEQGKREMAQAILNIDPRGGTVLRPAYEMALAELQNIQASIKHIIILSDGKLYDAGTVFGGSGNEVDFNMVASTALQIGITTSTIAIGAEADFERLEAIAQSGGGRYYQALEVSTLPRIFTNEALTATRSLIRDEPLSPILRPHPLISTSDAPPSLNAYIATSLKSSSEVILEGQEQEPILALSRQGLGRSAALTTDLNGWAGEFVNWNELPNILGTLVRWLQANPAQYEATVTHQGTQLHVVVDAVKNGEYINDKLLELRYGSETTTLEQSAPGRYETFIPAKADSENVLVVDGNDIVARAQLPKSSEFDNTDGQTLLQNLSERTGGQVIESLEGYEPITSRSERNLWSFIALAGLALFLLELILRRIMPNQALSRKQTA